MNVTFKQMAVAAVALVFASAAVAENHGPRKGNLYLNGFGHFYATSGSDFDDDLELGPGGGVGYGFTDRFLGEINFLNSEHDVDADSTDEVDLNQLQLDLIYKLSTELRTISPYVVGGYGGVEGSSTFSSFNDNQASLGFGLFSDITRRVAMRGEFRGVWSNDAEDIQPFFRLGLTAILGRLNQDVAGPVDSDGDGVFDPDDRCPNTPRGEAVDATGCPPAGPGDADGDGVPDNLDRCPTTPAGVAVDSRGCALDGDGDGVPDYKDKCPDSEAGAKVDADGCYVELEREVTIDLNLEFDTNSANLRTDHYPEIQRVVDFLKQYPTANAVIEGHTDSRGAAEYNQALSERRAASVRNYLVEQAGIRAGRLTSQGFGETRPKASNDTAEGRQQNRRVSAVVAGTQTVRQ